MGKYLCHCFLYSPDAIFKEVLIVAWARSRTPIVCMFRYGVFQIDAQYFSNLMYNMGDENASFVCYNEGG